MDSAARPFSRLQDGDFKSSLRQSLRSRQARHASSHYQHGFFSHSQTWLKLPGVAIELYYPRRVDLVGLGWTPLDPPSPTALWRAGWNGMSPCMASRGGFTRQPVNVASLELLTKVRPVR